MTGILIRGGEVSGKHYREVNHYMHTSRLRISPWTKQRLDRLKQTPEESYDQIINRLIDFSEDDEPLSEEEIAGIEESFCELEEGRFFTHEQVKTRIGLS
ncbi:MAG: hypothetical protein LUO97_04570 [Methanomicrobiales archaeon]|nr:hypothetical protein [Methanomicrobiales archaeon]